MKLRIFTDGACSGNPGPGGWAVLFNLQTKNKTISGNEVFTTNNRMELFAVIQGLKMAIEEYKPQGYTEIEVHSDSAYVVHAVEKGWINKWKETGWVTVKHDDVKNKDLWMKLDRILLENRDIIKFIKVKGHAGNTFNEIVDKLAVEEVAKAKEK